MSLNIDNNLIKYSEVQLFNVQLVSKTFSLNPVLLVLQKIFLNLDFSNLAKSSLVCRRWNQVISDPLFWKAAIYNQSFNNKKWLRCFGKEVVEIENEDVELSTLPNNIVDEYKKFHSVYPKIKVKDGLMLVRVPKILNEELTLNSLGTLAKQYFPKTNAGYKIICDSIVTALGDKSIDESDWLLMTKDILPGSKNKTFAEQQEMIADLAKATLVDYEVPATLEAAICILAQYFDSATCLFRNTYTRCKEIVEGDHVQVGGFTPIGEFWPGLSFYADEFGDDDDGVAALRKFKGHQLLNSSSW